MNLVALNNNNLIVNLENYQSEKIGLYFSFFIHFVIFLFAIGIPNFFEPKPITIPNIIPVEIINVTDVTSIPEKPQEKKEKEISQKISIKNKFNNTENKIVKKADIKIKPQISKEEVQNINNQKEDKIIREKKNNPIKLKKEDKMIDLEKTESLPSKKIKAKLKPNIINTEPEIIKNTDVAIKSKPKNKVESQFNIASMLKDLRNEKKSITNKKIEEKINEKNELLDDKDIKNENSQLSISEIDLLVQQLSSCWTAPAGAVIEKGMVVKIAAKIKPDGRVLENSIRIIDTNIVKSNSFYGPITESAMRTLLNPECIPLKLPKDKYNLWKELKITFDHSIMR